MIATFPYKGKDVNSRPALLRSKKMKQKGSRKVIFRVTKKMSVSQLENIKCSLMLISKPEVNTEDFVSF